MPCIKTPAIPFPELPAPFSIPSIGAATPGLGIPFCCKLPSILSYKVKVKLPPFNPALMAVIQAGIQTVSQVLRSRSLKCPRE